MKNIQYMVTLLDSDGMPRVWAVASDLEAASREAKRQLAIYRGHKAQLLDPLAADTFTENVIVLGH